jgi:DNA invertase Pin-like site-specific DNA recombinase
MSSARQDQSIASQRAEVKALAKRRGYEIVREYVDEAVSGDATEKRVAFLRMREDAPAGAFAVVLCWDQDRFGRFDPIEAGYWIKPFRDAGVRLETIAQGRIDWNDFTGRLVYMIHQEGKHQYLRDLSRNIIRGHLAGASRGEWQSSPPLGYVRHGKRLAIDPEKADVVRLIFDRYAGGLSLRNLAALLNREGVPTPRGRPWTLSTVQKVLVNVAYAGTYRFRPGRKAKYNHPEEGGEIVPGPGSRNGHLITRENNHPAIIDRELFDRVQRLLKARKRFDPGRAPGPYFLSHLLRCGDCGAGMVGVRHDRWQGYVCGRYHRTGRSVCHRNHIQEDRILPGIVRTLQEFWTRPGNVERVAAEVRRQLSPAPADPGARKRMEKQLAALDGRIARGAKRLLAADDAVYAELAAQMAEAKRERERLRGELEALAAPAAVDAALVGRMVDRAVGVLRGLADVIGSADHAAVREALAGVIDHVDLFFRQEPKRKLGRSVFEKAVIHLRTAPESNNGVPSDCAVVTSR